MVYLETTIVSYLTARPSRDLIIAAHQQITQEWWDSRRNNYDLYVSQLVVHEAGRGDPNAAARRLAVLDSIPMLALAEPAVILSEQFIQQHAIPEKAAEDALHIALATIHGVDYLLTWNCKHIANAERWSAIAETCRQQGYEPPIICTPEELLGE
ncbi:MAG: type II toxin-antitoxin system VapC family toxin [bacterium]|nr:type II toxin-antitoxin system VapC family toxin [bacterium]